MITGGNEYGLAEAAILSEPWLSAMTLPDALARPAILSAAVEQPTPVLRRVVIRKRGPELVVEVHASRPLSSTFLKSVEAVADLLGLARGWNSYAAKPIAPQNAIQAIRLLGEFLEPQTLPPAVVPRVQGGLQLEWHTESVDVEVYIDSRANVSFFAEDLESGQSDEGPLTGREHILKGWVKRVSRK
jgi:hypothetical protein